jgi:hypothetical protein
VTVDVAVDGAAATVRYLTTVLAGAGAAAVAVAECAAGVCITTTGVVPHAVSPTSPAPTATVDLFITFITNCPPSLRAPI